LNAKEKTDIQKLLLHRIYCRLKSIMRKRGILQARLTVGCLALLAALAGSPLPVAAGDGVMDRSLEELAEMGLSVPPSNVEVSTASKFQQSAAQAPTPVYVVTAEDIRTFGYRTLGEILRALPGLYVTNDYRYQYLGIRSFGLPGDRNTRVLILLDGERVNETFFDSALVGAEFPVDVDLIERVEYVPGPGSAIYGSNAFFGVVNVITKRGHALSGVELSGEYGRSDTYKARASFGQRFDNGADLLLSATRYDRGGAQRPYYWDWGIPAGDEDSALGLDYERADSAFAKWSYGPFTLEGGHLDRVTGLPPFVFDGRAFPDREGKIKNRRTFLTARYDDKVAPDWGLQLRLGYNRDSYFGTFPYYGEFFAPGTIDRVVGKESAEADWWGGEMRLTNTSLDRHRLTMGAEWQTSFRTRAQNSIVDGPTFLDFPYRYSRYGFYLQDEFRLLDSLTLLAEARYDTSPFGDSANPRLGLIWRPRDATTIKLLYGTAFRAPSLFENLTTAYLYGQPAAAIDVENTGLHPEEIETFQLGLEHYLTPSTRLTAALYRYRMDGLLGQGISVDDQGNVDTYFVNISEVTGQGLEVEAETRFGGGVRANLSYSLQHSQDEQGRRPPNSPEHMLKFHLSAPLWSEHWRLGLEALYLSERDTWNSKVDDVAVTNLTLSGEVSENAGVSFGLYNIGNVHYADPVNPIAGAYAIEQDGFNVRFKLNIGF
jgi:iron complex outermembrane receptor protein